MAISRVALSRSIGYLPRRLDFRLTYVCSFQSANFSYLSKSNNLGLTIQKPRLSIQTQRLSTKRKYDDGIDVNNQTVEIDPVERIRRCTVYKDIDLYSYYKSVCPDVRILGDVLEYGRRISNDGPCLGFIQSENKAEPIRWLSYSMVIDQVNALGTYLWTQLKLTPTDSRVAIMTSNRPEFPIVGYACCTYGFIVVGLFTTYDEKTILSLLQKTQTKVLVVDSLTRIRAFEKKLIENDEIKEIIVMDDIGENENKKIKSLSSIIKSIDKKDIRPRPSLDPETIVAFLLTSGTTGEPKIAKLSHDNVMAAMQATLDRESRAGILCKPSDRHCSFLPVAHLYEQAAILLMLVNGSRIVCCPTPEKLVEYYALVKPTRVFMVPRILNKIYDKIMSEVEKSKIKRFLVQLALRQDHSTFLSRIVFRKVRQVFGGEVNSLLSASAPVSGDVLRFFRIALDIPIYGVFGQTESSGVNVTTHVSDTSCGTVGTPVCSMEVKLIDVPGTNYRSENGQGEICLRGPTVFKGYHGDEAKTKEAIDEKGWLHTGDIGEWTKNGTLRIIDRCKHIFKLSQGKYVAPERLEEIYLRSRWISQIFIDGRPMHATVVAIVVPDEEYIKSNYISNSGQTFEELCKDEKLKQLIMEDLLHLAKENQLQFFETISNIYVSHEAFSQQNGLITTTLKTRRSLARQRFQTIIDSLYNEKRTDKTTKITK